jgi:hypothetical protein
MPVNPILSLAAPTAINAIMKARERQEREAELKSARRDWNETYKVRQRQQGVPDRRLVAESMLLVIMAKSRKSRSARFIMRHSARRLLRMKAKNGEPKFTKAGILKRWTALFEEVNG